mgnify:CR=1 FL=1|tara:strand:- start:2089 stop:3558 length:1470 start_codon:yes stop_codon:yes gene_type:complete
MKSKGEFFILKKVCDKILSEKLDLFIISNNSLNLIKGHPFHLSTYNWKTSKKLFKLFYYLIRNFIYLFVSIKKSYFPNKQLKRIFTDVLIVSSLVNINDLNKKDYIFSDLENKFKKAKIKYHKLLINHTDFSKEEIKNKLIKKKNVSILEFNYCDYKNTLLVMYNQIKYFILFLINSMKEKDKKRKNIFFLSAIEFLNLSTKKNLNLMYNYEIFLKSLNFNKLVIPYEGYSWERLLIKCSKNKKKKLNSFGYHFSAISEFQHSIFRKIGFGYEPDNIYTTGKFSRDEFKKKINCKIKILGSNRFYPKKSIQKKRKKKIINCLVLPEGIKSECLKLFSFSILAAKKFPKVRFIWRLHPSMSSDKIFPIFGYSVKKLPKNIQLSKNSFFKDVESADLCLYRGSTSAITALQNGTMPVYLNDASTLNIDPLFKLKSWKQSINNLKDFDEIIKGGIKNIKKNTFDKKFAINFSLKYFEKLNYKILLRDLKKNK